VWRVAGESTNGNLGLKRMASKGLKRFSMNSYQLEIHVPVPVRTVYRIKYVLYMYNLGTAPNVQNWAGFAACTPVRAGRIPRRGVRLHTDVYTQRHRDRTTYVELLLCIHIGSPSASATVRNSP